MLMTKSSWRSYIDKLHDVNTKAADLMRAYIDKYGVADRDALIRYAYGLVSKYGETGATLAAEMYDSVAMASRAKVTAAIPADTASIDTVGEVVNGALKTTTADVPSAVYRLTKQAAADTTMQNVIRDKAEFAWIPVGDTCAYCLAIAANGWQPARKATMHGGHAEHIHANCDCNFAVRFSPRDSVQGYDPEVYQEIYNDAPGRSATAKINAIRREQYAEQKDHINELKRMRYAAQHNEDD